MSLKQFIILTLICSLAGCNNAPTESPTLKFSAVFKKDTTVILSNKDTATIHSKDTTICAVITRFDTTIKKYVPPVVTPPPTTERKNIIAYWGYETSDYSPWKFTQLGTKSSPSTLHARAGRQSMRFELNKTDPLQAKSNRAEFNLEPESSNPVERWYASSFYVESPYKADPSCPEIWKQWHHNGDGPPPLALWSYGNTFGINQRVSSTAKEQFTKLGNIVTDKWMDFVWHIKWSSGSDGLIEIWMNGTKIFTKAGANNWSGNAGKNYMKSGIYKWGWAGGYKSTVTQRVLFIDEERIGNEKATYNDVVPGP